MALFFFACLPSIAFADCAAPAGIEGETLYNTDFKTIQFCDGTDWISMSGTAATETDPKIGTLTNTKWCATDGSVINCTEDAPGNATPAGTDGQVQFNESSALAADAALHWGQHQQAPRRGAVPSSNGRLHVEASAVNTYTAWFSHTNATNANGINIETATGNAGDIGLRVVSDGGSIVGLVVRNDGDVSIGTASPAATALLDLTSTSKGFLPPRMDTTQRNTIASPAEGLTIYNTTTDSLEFYNGSAWVSAANADVSFAAKGATTSIPNGAWTDAVYPTELRDAGGDNYNPATGKFTAPSDGMYFFAATTQFSGQISAGQWGIIVQTANASTGGTRACYQMNPKASGGANYASVACSGSLYLTAGTQVEATVYQDSGGVQALSTAGSFNGFKVTGGGSALAAGQPARQARLPARCSSMTAPAASRQTTSILCGTTPTIVSASARRPQPRNFR
ncbi:MAG: complement C1q domain-containing protein [Hyphomicrobium sp.]|nr:complement C1q domain-containing protein [Hyphomicrobium sp.]